jgi:hypothetical protein
MGWTWHYETSEGQTPDPLPAAAVQSVFPSQSDAENFIGESWQELLDAGIDQVSLFEGDRQVYGPMSLHPPK